MKHFKTLGLTIGVIVCCSAAANGQLPPEAKAKLLDRKIVAAIEAEDLQQVDQLISEYRTLGAAVPGTYLFIQGKIANSKDDHEKAKSALEAYFNSVTPAHSKYDEALDIYQSIEEKRDAETQRLIDEENIRVEETRRLAKEESDRKLNLKNALNSAEVCMVPRTTPAVTQTVSKNVMIQEAYEGFAITPATFETVRLTRIVRPAAREDSTFEKIDEYLVVSEGYNNLEEIPPEYEIVKETIQLGRDRLGRLVEKEQIVRVITKPATMREITVPAVTRTFQTEKIKKKGRSRNKTPALTQTYTKQTLKSEAVANLRTVPSISKRVAKTVEIQAKGEKQIEAICDYKSNQMIRDAVQSKMIEVGYIDSSTDFVSEAELDAAIAKFQNDKFFIESSKLTAVTIKRLGLGE